MDRVMLFFENGTPVKPFPLIEAKSACKKCGAAVRWVKDRTVGVRMPVDKDVYIVQPAPGFGIGHRKYVTSSGDVISGEPRRRGVVGCEVAYRLHDCTDCSTESRAEVKIIKGASKKRRK